MNVSQCPLSPRRCAFFAAALSLSTATGLVAVPVLFSSRPAAAAATPAAQQKEKEKRMIEATLPALVKTEEAEKLFGEKKWAECLAAIDEATKLYDNAFKRFPDAAQQVTLEITPQDLPAARKYGFVITEAAAFPVQKYGIGKTHDNVVVVPVRGARVTSAYFGSFLPAMRPVVLALSGKAVPYINDGDSKPNEVDAKDFYMDAYAINRNIEMPVPDDQWEGVVLLLTRASLMLDAGRAMNPKLENEELPIAGETINGAGLRKAVLSKLAEAEKEYKPAASRLFAEAPAVVENDRNHLMAELDGVIERINNGSYYDIGNAGLVGGWSRDTQFAQLRKSFAEAYAKEAKPMPADVMKPIQDKIAEVNAILDKKAPGYHFTAKSPAPAGIAAAAKSELLKSYPGATVVRVGMDDTAFGINRDELGNLVSRGRSGRILFKMPGEKWHRLLLFDYVEANAGGNSYVAPGRVGLGNILRFQSGS